MTLFLVGGVLALVLALFSAILADDNKLWVPIILLCIGVASLIVFAMILLKDIIS